MSTFPLPECHAGREQHCWNAVCRCVRDGDECVCVCACAAAFVFLISLSAPISAYLYGKHLILPGDACAAITVISRMIILKGKVWVWLNLLLSCIAHILHTYEQ